jgi:hypothetical protein
MSGAPAVVSEWPRSVPRRNRDARRRAQWWLAADALDDHAVRCGCVDDPCDDALRLAEDEIEAWERIETGAG